MPPVPTPLTVSALEEYDKKTMKSASSEWKKVFLTGVDYLKNRSDPRNMVALNDAINDWRIEKAKPRWFRRDGASRMRGLDWIEALEKDLLAQPTPPSIPIESREAVDYWDQQRENTLIRILSDAVIVPEQDYQLARELQALASSTLDATNAWLDVAGKDSVETMTSSAASEITGLSLEDNPLTPFTNIINDLFSELEATAKAQAITVLKDIIGVQIFNELSKCVPYLGTVKEGKELFDTTRECVRASSNAYRTRAAQRTVRPGDAQAAVKALSEMLERDLAELTLNVASQATNFGVGIASLVGTGSDSASLISRAVTATAGLLRTIYDFGRDYLEQYRANKILRGGITNLNYTILATCPLLGSHIIELADASFLMDIDLKDANFIHRLGSARTGELAKAAGELKARAVQVNRSSRFRIVYNIDRVSGETTTNVYAHIAAKDKERRILAARETLRKRAIEIGRNQLIMQQIREFKAKAITQIALEQKLESQKKLADLVGNAVKTYKEQIKGFFTRQSAESTAAYKYLENLLSQPIDDRLEQTVAWLLDTTYQKDYEIEGLSKRLKRKSRLQGLLSAAYNEWIASR